MNKYTRISVLFLCISLLLSLFAYVTAADVSAGEKVTYVLSYDGDDDGYSGPELQYFSPYRIQYRMNHSSLQTMRSCVFSLYNTLDGSIIPAYCLDANVLANSNFVYRRVNLEDSAYAPEAAGMVRSIVHNGFYLMHQEGETEEAHALRVAQELERLGAAAGVEGLTIGEAITGTQTAIWKATHGSALSYNDFMYSAYKTDVSDSVRYYEICDEERWNGHIEYTGTDGELFKIPKAKDKELGERIEAVYTYLMALSPMEPGDVVVSPASFVSVEGPFSYDKGDDTFDMTVTVTVDLRVEAGDSLKLTASLGKGAYSASAPLADGLQTISLTLENVPNSLKKEKVLLEIDGMQSGSDVYLFDAEGDRETSQTMVGMLNGSLPVYTSTEKAMTPGTPAETEGETDGEEPHEEEPQRILNFYKTTELPDGTDAQEAYPLEGITFDIYLVAQRMDYITGKVTLPENAADYPCPDTPDITLETGADGKASVNFTQLGMPDGIYLVVEREHPAIVSPVDPFYVSMPYPSPQGTGYEYEVTVQPKNQVKGFMQIQKDVISLGNDSASVDAYSPHTWIVGVTIPEDIGEGKHFEISDTLDPRLDYSGNLRVRVETTDGGTAAVVLTEGRDYLLNVSYGGSGDSFSLSLTPEGRKTVATAVGEDPFDSYMLRVYFDAQINGNAQPGEEIPNQASFCYTNSVNFDFSGDSDIPHVSTGGIEIEKVDGQDPALRLPGGVFELYRRATEEEVAAGEGLHRLSGFPAPMVKVAFFDNRGLTGEKVTSVTSDREGVARFYGLAYGTYYLLETSAPQGYNLPVQASEILIDGDSHGEDRRVTVENVIGTVLPSTGGPGASVYLIPGLLLLLASVTVLLRRKYRAPT